MMKRIPRLASIVLALSIAASHLPAQTFEDFGRLKDVRVKETLSDQFAGKPLLVGFWSSKCSGCIKELPGDDSLASILADRIPFCWVATHTKKSELAKLVDEKYQNMHFYRDRGNFAYSAFDEPMWSSVYLFDEKRELIWSGMTYEIDVAVLQSYLESRPRRILREVRKYYHEYDDGITISIKSLSTVGKQTYEMDGRWENAILRMLNIDPVHAIAWTFKLKYNSETEIEMINLPASVPALDFDITYNDDKDSRMRIADLLSDLFQIHAEVIEEPDSENTRVILNFKDFRIPFRQTLTFLYEHQ